MIIPIILTAALIALTLAATYYFRRSANSIVSAERVWAELSTVSREIVNDRNYPQQTAWLAMAMAKTSGCGCFVRGMIVAHYAPSLALAQHKNRQKTEAGQVLPNALGGLTAAQRKRMDKLMMLVVVYDSFANPLQGWIFRRLIRLNSTVRSEQRAEAKEVSRVTFDVVTRKARHEPELCAA